MAKLVCYGCDGKGWVMVISSERTTPFLSQIDRKPVPGAAVMTREYAAVDCPICKGDGIVHRAADPGASEA